MKNIIVRCGSQTFHKQFPDEATVGEVVRNSSVKAVLGYGDSTRALINGVEQDDSLSSPADCTITVETRCNSKAV